MSLTNKPRQERISDNRRDARVRLVHPVRFLVRLGVLVALVALVLLLAGYLRDAGQGIRHSPESSPSAVIPLESTPAPTPVPTPTPLPTPPPAPAG